MGVNPEPPNAISEPVREAFSVLVWGDSGSAFARRSGCAVARLDHESGPEFLSGNLRGLLGRDGDSRQSDRRSVGGEDSFRTEIGALVASGYGAWS
jgi:hypothetical protein